MVKKYMNAALHMAGSFEKDFRLAMEVIFKMVAAWELCSVREGHLDPEWV